MATKKATTNQELYQKFLSPFKDEAYTCDSSRGFNLTSLKPQYIRERLNEVCDIDGWKFTGEYQQVDNGVLFFGKLEVKVGHDAQGVPIWHAHEAPGYSAHKKNVGDTYKSAQTDSLSKCASNFGIGNEMFKGNIAPPVKGGLRNASTATKPKTTAPAW